MFAVLGEALLDMVQTQRGTTYVARPGGGPFNIAVGLRRLGHPTALLARISTRGLGGIVRAHAARNDLDLSGCIDTDDQTTLAFASLDEDGSRVVRLLRRGHGRLGLDTGRAGHAASGHPGLPHRLVDDRLVPGRRRGA